MAAADFGIATSSRRPDNQDDLNKAPKQLESEIRLQF
jgi:hypothetical protein